ncbi:hypothetical protein [Spiroplasma endosymbiont of Acasis viretata]|uniref:hypothetical protein n=1 Tax=Spiroplasma endosymbiont of Acasis viretata TaxID=3066306 RepID=UPI00313B0DAD
MDIQQDFYIKKVFYASYVKNVVLPISFLNNVGNIRGKSYVGNKQKWWLALNYWTIFDIKF